MPNQEAKPSAIARVDVLGIGVSVVDLDAALAAMERWICRREQHYVCVTGVHGVMESQRDADLLRIHNESGLTVADGMPMLWAGRYARAVGMGRIRGQDLLPALCELAVQRNWRSYFYGGGPHVAETLVEHLQSRFPGFQCAGWHTPPFRSLSKQEDDDVVRKINAARPDLIWVGLSTPKQEMWMAQHIHRMNAQVLIGVGAAFDVHAGLARQAPLWVQRSGFEWLYRLRHDPARLWRRYLQNNPRFVAAVVRRPPYLRSS